MSSKAKLQRVVFAYDGDFKCFEGVYYSGGGFPAQNWSRYLAFSQNLTIAARVKDVEYVPVPGVVSSREGVSFTRVPNISGPLRRAKHYRLACQILRDSIRSADLVVVRLPSEIGLTAINISIREKKPYAIELVGDVKESMRGHGSLAGKLYSPIVYRRTKKVVNSSAACIYVTERYLQNIYPCGGIVGHASNVNLQLDSISKIECNIRSRSKSRENSFGLIGSLKSDYKGVDLAIKAVSRLKERGVHVHLRILGSGDPTRYVKLAEDLSVADFIHFDGVRAAPQEVGEWLDGVTYYMQPSRTEGLPRSLIEAMARGLPAIGSDRGGIPELLPDECLFEVSDIGRLTELMERLINLNEEEYVQLALNSYRSSAKYDQGALEQQRAAFWQQVIHTFSPGEG